MNNLSKRGFTLIELLGVILILGILMIIAIPAITSYIDNSRKKTFVSNAKTFIDAARKINIDESLVARKEGEIKVLNITQLDVIGEKSPYGSTWDYDNSFVEIYFSENEFYYSIQLIDLNKNGIELIYEENLTEKMVVKDCKPIRAWDTSEMVEMPNYSDGNYKYEEITGGIRLKEVYNISPYMIIPNTIDGKKVLEIAAYCFEGEGIKRVIIPDSVTKIERGAFSSNQIDRVVIPDSVTEIERGAFHANNIRLLLLGKNVKKIGEFAFDTATITSITLPNQLETLDQGVFADSKFTTLTLPSSLKNLPDFLVDHYPQEVIIKGKGTEDCFSIGEGKFNTLGSTHLFGDDVTILCME